jgi:hypothetical protein
VLSRVARTTSSPRTKDILAVGEHRGVKATTAEEFVALLGGI